MQLHGEEERVPPYFQQYRFKNVDHMTGVYKGLKEDHNGKEGQ